MLSTSYNVEFIKPNQEKITLDNLNMKDTIEKTKQLIKQYYHLDMNITRNVIYGLVKRPNMVNKIIKSFLSVKVLKTEKEPFKIKYIYNTKSKREHLKRLEEEKKTSVKV